MNELTRRAVMKLAAAVSAAGVVGETQGAPGSQGEPGSQGGPGLQGGPGSPAAPGAHAGTAGDAEEGRKGGGQKADRDFVMEAGMTEGEAECWRLAAETAGAFFALPEVHPMDKQEVATAIHVIQNKLLSRPTYRKYLEAAKAGRG